jgi:hypothetical protein
LSVSSRDSIDQALFGYADGHRQIASSVHLPPKDLYLLSSASDLASGVRLRESDSYLSGLPLPESRRYALFRTWSAPEMPRPGCVWTHVLLLGPKVSASIPALSEVLPLFRRPGSNEISSYEDPLEIPASKYVEPARANLISEVISGYYIAGRATLSPDSGEPDEIENAVLAVWSQQWPRLRASFSFCTAALNENRRTELSDYSVQVSPLDRPSSVGHERWVSFASSDAALNKVTPLRRFLWRYGRDIMASRRHYRMIVDLFLHSEGSDVISADAASEIFRALPDPTDGTVLKRDILGIGPSSPRLVAAISAVDLLQLLTLETLTETPTAAQVKNRLEELTSVEIGTVARYYVSHKETLSPWKQEIYGAIVSLADKSSITTEYPNETIADVLLAREDLVDADTLPLVANDILPRLLKDSSSFSLASLVISEMLRRDMGDLADGIISSLPELLFQSAVAAECESRLHHSWLGTLTHRVETILSTNWLPRFRSTKELAAALFILRYPRYLALGSAEIAKCMSEMVDYAEGEQRTTMQAALLRTAIDESSAGSWNLISIVLPELRNVVIKAGLPRTAESMLISDLPHFYSAGYWDLNMRILLALSKLNLTAPSSVVHHLALKPAELEVVLHGEESTAKKRHLTIWDWFS